MLKQFTQFITLISSHLCINDSSAEVYMVSINVSISIDDAIWSRQHAKSELAHSLQGFLSTDVKQTSSQ